MDLPFIPAIHTQSIKPCQTKEGSSFMLQTYTQTHTCTHTGGKLIYAAVYYHYHQMRGSEQEPGCISLLDAHHHRLSLRCLSGCHFSGGPAGVLILHSSSPLFCPLNLLHCFYRFLHSLLFCFVSFLFTFYILFRCFPLSLCPSSHIDNNSPLTYPLFAQFFVYRSVYFLGLFVHFQKGKLCRLSI